MDYDPPITLDYTLHDLYGADSEDGLNTVLIYYPVQFRYKNEGELAKFAYGYKMEDDDYSTMAANLVPQRYAFSAGKMPLVILDVTAKRELNSKGERDPRLADFVSAHHLDIYQTFAQLQPHQRPIVSFAKSPESIELGLDSRIAVLVPNDCLSHLPHLTCPETHYEILSKRGLAMSGLPTPPSQVIDTILADYEDPSLLAIEAARMILPIEQHQLPFMVKLPQSVSGMGTFAVTSETDRMRIKSLITTQLGIMLRQLNQSNWHLHPCSIILQDIINGPVVALSLFVTKTGQPIFIACCEQLFDDKSHWIGGRISYQQQAGYRNTFSALMIKVAAFLHHKGYHGPAGVDIVTDQYSGDQFVIDLNVRVTGTFHLGPLAGHFTRRGMFEAAITCGEIFRTREVFEEVFSEEIRQGSIIVSGWIHDDSRSKSHAAITVGARDYGSLQKHLRRIRAEGLQT